MAFLDQLNTGLGNSMQTPLFQLGAGILGANQGGASFGQAMGGGAQYAIQQQRATAQQQRREKLVDKELEKIEAQLKRSERISQLREKVSEMDPDKPGYGQALSMLSVIEGQPGVAMGLNTPVSTFGRIGQDEARGLVPQGTQAGAISDAHRPPIRDQPSFGDYRMEVTLGLLSKKVREFTADKQRPPNEDELAQIKMDVYSEVKSVEPVDPTIALLVESMTGGGQPGAATPPATPQGEDDSGGLWGTVKDWFK